MTKHFKLIDEQKKGVGAIVCLSDKFIPMVGDTSIFIYPGFEFKAVDNLITNFHLPKSTLVMLVSALAGKENILNA